MPWSGEQSRRKTPDSSQRPGHYGDFRSPYPSPWNEPDFAGHMKNFGRGYHCFQNERFHYSPTGNKRRGGGGHFRGRGSGYFRGSSGSDDISLYVDPSMLSDPWKELEDTLGLQVVTRVSLNSEVSAASTPNTSSVSAIMNASVSNDDKKENVTEDKR